VRARNRNELWAIVLLDELARGGVQEIIVSPGSRSTPLVLAAAQDPRFRLSVQIDERSAGFLALGVGKGTGRPAAVITTSGTAVANLLPAVVEGAQSETPLLLLTADRPAKLRGADANQTIDQVGIFGGYLRFEAELSPAELSEEALRHLRMTAARALAAAIGDPGGPVHLNLPFDKPLEPIELPGELPGGMAAGATLGSGGRGGGAPFVGTDPFRPPPTPGQMVELREALTRACRPLLVGGIVPRPGEVGPCLRGVGEALGVPVLADLLSGARGGSVIGGYDAILRSTDLRRDLLPDLIVRVGAAPTSSTLGEWLASLDVPHLLIDSGGRWKDHSGTVTHRVQADPATLLEALLVAPPSMEMEPGWLERWSVAERALRGVLELQALDGIPTFEGMLLRGVAADPLPPGGLLFVSNSMPVRDLDTFLPEGLPSGEVALGNRGASGIDGIVSTAAGISLGTGRPVLALLGDLALLHDSNGLSALALPGVQLVLAVVNNDGGGIFHLLPIRGYEPAFTPFFATPHGRELGGWPHCTTSPASNWTSGGPPGAKGRGPPGARGREGKRGWPASRVPSGRRWTPGGAGWSRSGRIGRRTDCTGRHVFSG